MERGVEGVQSDGEWEREAEVGVEGAQGDWEAVRRGEGVTGLRSVTTRMGKRGGMAMEGEVGRGQGI